MINSELMLLLGLGALLLSLAGGLLRALRGPALEDRMLSVLLLGTGGTGCFWPSFSSARPSWMSPWSSHCWPR